MGVSGRATEEFRPGAIARLRLRAQGLLPDPDRPRDPAAVVRALGMVQAQDLVQGFWAIGVRLPSSTAGTVRDALGRGTLVRIWGARGTLMLVVPADVRPLLSVTAERMRAQSAGIHRREGITAAELADLLPLALELCGSTGASRAQLLAAFAAAGHDTTAQRGYHLLVALCLGGEVVQGPMEPGSDTRQLFMASSGWLPHDTVPPGNNQRDALTELVLRYFLGHGPATVADCAWWLGLPLTPVRAALAELEGQLAQRSIAGQHYLYDPALEEAWEQPPGATSMLALPGFDEFLLGYKDRTPTLPAEHADAVTPGGNGVFRRTLCLGGATIGTWRPAGPKVQPASVQGFAGELPERIRARALARIGDYEHFRAR